MTQLFARLGLMAGLFLSGRTLGYLRCDLREDGDR